MEDNAGILDGLEERLQSHARAFESLLALTPARDYYGSQVADGQDPSEQWNRKKQTKEQKRAAKKAKLDPANQKSALDVMKEKERKRKRELGEEDGEDQNSHEPNGGDSKLHKGEDDEDATEARRRAKADKRKEKRLEKKEKSMKKKVKAEAKKAAKQDQDLEDLSTEKAQAQDATDVEEDDDMDADSIGPDAEVGAFDASGLAEEPARELVEVDAENVSEASSVPSSPAVDSPAFDVATNHSTASSSSSIIPPSEAEPPAQPKRSKHAQSKPIVDTTVALSLPAETSHKPAAPPSGISSPKLQLPNIDQAELQERLRQRIEELRARRKADGPDGKPAKSRQELLDQRRQKEEQRKAANKERRRKVKEDEQRKLDEQVRGSGSPMSADVFGPRSPRPQENSFSFSRLAFEDGTSADPSLTGLADPKKKKGPQDPRTALEAAQKKQARIAGYDEEKRADIAEKDLWLNAKKRTNGERVRDDTSLLKKALKRKEKAKGKSEQQWKEREQAVVHGKEMKQKKRETNLAKRKEEKGGSKGKKKSGGQKPGGKKGARPGFEGRFKA